MEKAGCHAFSGGAGRVMNDKTVWFVFLAVIVYVMLHW